MSAVLEARHQISRVRREPRRRTVEVTAVARLTPHMQRISFASPDLHDFDSPSPDDHIKLFFPATEADPDRPVMRDYTPRRFDPELGALTIDFALHAAGQPCGPATAWAQAARVGDRLAIGGPRGSTLVADDFDWMLLIGDETALPAIGRRIEAMRPGGVVTSLAVVQSATDCQTFETKAAWSPHWVVRDGAEADDATLLAQALTAWTAPPGDGYIWIAAEARTARALHGLLGPHHPKAWLKAAGYWTSGQADTHGGIA